MTNLSAQIIFPAYLICEFMQTTLGITDVTAQTADQEIKKNVYHARNSLSEHIFVWV